MLSNNNSVKMLHKYLILLFLVSLSHFGVTISGHRLENVLMRPKQIRNIASIWDEPISTTTESDDPNPCHAPRIPKPPKPDFFLPGIRISEAKCLEYIWESKIIEDQDNQDEACMRYMHVDSVIGGRDTRISEFRHMVAIGWKGRLQRWIFKCGGSVISPKFVLTAAHCSMTSSSDVTILDPVPKIVRLGQGFIGDSQYSGFQLDVNISRIISHPNYKSPKKYNDIALMELEEEVELTGLFLPACLWNNFDTSSLGNNATLTGWGVTETGVPSDLLKAAVVDIIDSQNCDDKLQHICNRLWCGVEDTQLCAGKLEGGVDTCQGDSGGPLQVKIVLPSPSKIKMFYLIGVSSFGHGCALPNEPGVYTRVSAFVDWIEQVVWPQNNTTFTSVQINAE